MLASLGDLPPLQPMPALAGASAAPGGMSRAMGAAGGMTINIVVNPAPGMDEKKLANLVAQKLREAQLGREARARSRLSDAD